MTERLTLPQQRAQETRQRILDAACQVFGRRGYGQATVDEIAAEAGVSMGALYHHFASKEELFRAILEDHVREAEWAAEGIAGASSFREVVERFVGFFLLHLQSEHESAPLSMEFWAQATRDPSARDAIAGFHREGLRLIGGMLRICQSAGVVRPDLDIDAAAILVLAVFEGLQILRALDPEGVNLERLREPWVDLIERFIKGEGEADINELQARMVALWSL